MSKTHVELICNAVRAHGRMDENDINNLTFLLSIDKATMADWYSKMDRDDIDYARELLQKAHTSMLLAELEVGDRITETPDADALFSKIVSKNN